MFNLKKRKTGSAMAAVTVIAGLVTLGLGLASPANAAPSNQTMQSNVHMGDGGNTDTWVFVCKYVGKPGVDERLKDGKQPIRVKSSATVGTWFNDAQGRSYVLDISTDANTGQGNVYTGSQSCPAPDSGPAKDASASVSVTAATCDAPATLVYGDIVNATFSGTPNGSTGPGTYDVTATSTDASLHVFANGDSTQEFTGNLSGAIPSQSTDPSAPCYKAPPATATLTTSHQTAVCTEGNPTGNVLTVTNSSDMAVTLTLTEGSAQRQSTLAAGQTTTFNDNWLQHEGMPYGTISLSAVASVPGTTVTFDGGDTWTPVDPATLSCGPTTSTWTPPAFSLVAKCVDPKTGVGDIEYTIVESAKNVGGTTYRIQLVPGTSQKVPLPADNHDNIAIGQVGPGTTASHWVSTEGLWGPVTVKAGDYTMFAVNYDDATQFVSATVHVEACSVTPPVTKPPVVTPPVVKPPVVAPPAHQPVGPSAHTGLDTAANPQLVAMEQGAIAAATIGGIFAVFLVLRRRKLAKVGTNR
ncbi:MAG TPA: hypothetical protein VN081_00290 [Dongiaceae bacterium]|nr:hypothetical protein [Dongiaceae bacterium]